MIQVFATSKVGATRLWGVVANITAWPNHVPTFSSISPLPGVGLPEVGAAFRVRQPGLASATYKVTHWEDGRSFTWVARSPGVTTTAVHTVSDEVGGARLELQVMWAGALAPLVRLLLARRSGHMVQAEAYALVDWAERDAHSP